MADTQPSILVADDDRDFRQLVVDFLGIKGFLVESVGDGEEAVKRAQEHQPDMILLDVDMPKKNGLEATVDLQADPRTKNIKIIYLSNLGKAVWSANSPAAQAVAAKIGEDDYFRKGNDLELLAEHIRKCLK